MQSQIESDLHDLCLVHGDAVVWVFGELVQGTGSGSVHQWVRGVQVGHQWGHGLRLAKCNTIVTPHAAPGDKEGAQSWYTHIHVTERDANGWKKEASKVIQRTKATPL